jgi:hypothetical protein
MGRRNVKKRDDSEYREDKKQWKMGEEGKPVRRKVGGKVEDRRVERTKEDKE